MKKELEISTYIYVLMMLFVFGCSTAFGQTFINGDFDEKIAKNIVAVEFWADWNQANQFEDLEKPKPGTGIYTIDMGDPAATNTWPPTRMEFNMKDQMARNKIDAVIKEMDELKEEIKLLRQ